MLELYHGGTSVCAQKVRLTLAEKGLEWKSHLLNLSGAQLRSRLSQTQPQRRGADLVHDGNVIVEPR